MAGDFATMVRPAVDARLDPGETVVGIAAATQQKTFSGQLFAVAVTDRRLLLMPVDRKFQAKGEPTSVPPEALASADLDGAGGGWWTAPAAVLDAAALTLRLETTGGEKFKLSMMKGGSGLLGGLGGGQSQSDGVVAMAEWLARARGGGTG